MFLYFPKINTAVTNGCPLQKFWKLSIDKDTNKTTLAKKAGISTFTVTKLAKNENVSIAALQKICAALECDEEDIMEMIPEKVQ